MCGIVTSNVKDVTHSIFIIFGFRIQAFNIWSYKPLKIIAFPRITQNEPQTFDSGTEFAI
jgi:hypothetical protein